MLDIIFDIFTTREIASGIWIILFFVYFILLKNTRNSFFQIIKIACSKEILIPIFILIIYSAFLIALFLNTPLWQIVYVKIILIWTLFIGIPMCFKAAMSTLETDYIKRIFIDGFKYTVFVGYITGLFTFSLLTEFIMVPAFAGVVLSNTFSESSEKYSKNKKKASRNLIITILIFSVMVTINAIEIYSSLDGLEILIGFLIPIALSILYIPFVYLFAIYGKYDKIFSQMKIKGQIKKNNALNHKKYVLFACGLSYNKLLRFEKYCIKEMYSGMSEKEFNQLIDTFKAF
ncbi:hypothetical protein L0665_10195 [Methanogenium marinum]|uniref:Uncharacterized protein n=1 Tax=Methanogenium marinum TaxID=348610 RepID=A0A9Q4KVF2_9EURY|nr:hypothetical protein [Methanogenium marinum]MDE4908977.1 hypothetical protein [Methanogenium marinum]